MSQDLCLGVDLGGTNIKVALVTEDGKVIKKVSVPTEAENGPQHVLSRIASEGLKLASQRPKEMKVVCVGVGLPGPMNSELGIVYEAPNMPGWNNIEARRILREKMKLPVALNNDANCAAWGEYFAGAGRGCRSMVCMTLGTGIGGGIIIDGKLFKGACDSAGEIGHMTIKYDSEMPYYITPGAFESLASATGLARFARMAIESGEKTTLKLDPNDASRPSARDVYEAAEKGDAVAARLMDQAGMLLGVGVSNMINILNPDCIVFTGGMAACWKRIEGPTMAEAKRRAFRRPFEACHVRLGELWEDAGVIGAAGLGFIEMKNAK
ncbi:MAG: ROK family protein [Candidatus Sumerlaeota bacterium]|nr:ROK family protein [Candidatus Sumerlaeota bacterium]